MAEATTFEGAAGKTGTVTVGDAVLTVGPLSLEGEGELYDRLAAMAKAEMGTYYSVVKPMLAEMDPQDREVAVVRVTDLEAKKEPPSFAEVQRFRRTARGAAHELFTRAKKYNPDLAENTVTAVVTAANAGDVARQIRAAVTAETPAGKP